MAGFRLLLYALVLPCLVVLGHRLYTLCVNYHVARKLKVPIVIIPVSWQDDAWLLCWEWFTWLKCLPFVDGWFDYTRFAWTQDHRFRPHRRHGDAFAVVAPGGVELFINDPQAANEMQAKYRNWFKPEPLFALVDIFGKSVLSVNGDDWQRHRRIVNPAFHEQNNKLVWDEARRQAHQMLIGWLERGHTTIDNVSKDCVMVALHVLSAAGFGQKHDFRGGLGEVPSGHVKSFSDTISFLLNQAILVLLFRNIQLPDRILPQQIRDVKNSVLDFRLYMREAIAFTKGLIQGGSATQTADMASTLISANEGAKREADGSASHPDAKPIYLSDDDVLGNLYIINIAGHETTANALIYAIPYLAANPDVQKWVREEIEQVTHGASDSQGWAYEQTFPQLIRCLALLYETLRLWPPITDSTRWTAGESQHLRVGEQDLLVPKGVLVTTNISGIHSDPRWWGADSLEWKPKRWITIDAATEKETIASPPYGAFFAWSVGPRVCPGKKFSQVEFTAVISTLLAKYTLEPLVMEEKGMKTKDDATKAVHAAIWASNFKLTPKIGRGNEAGVLLVKR